jgi:hypothetical protein
MQGVAAATEQRHSVKLYITLFGGSYNTWLVRIAIMNF